MKNGKNEKMKNFPHSKNGWKSKKNRKVKNEWIQDCHSCLVSLCAASLLAAGEAQAEAAEHIVFCERPPRPPSWNYFTTLPMHPCWVKQVSVQHIPKKKWKNETKIKKKMWKMKMKKNWKMKTRKNEKTWKNRRKMTKIQCEKIKKNSKIK